MSETFQPHSTRARPRPTGGRFVGEPNPLLVRELRQALRLPRLPWTICAVVALVGLGMLSFGSLEGGEKRPAQLGFYLFTGFISILLLYVALVGPATAAGAIATEREGKTLEPLLLTSLSPRDIARGKFFAAYGTIGLQVLAMMPLAAIPLLFGGVTAVELLVSFVFVAGLAAVSVAFGLAVASRAQTLRSALAVSILLPAAAAPLGFIVSTYLGDEIARRRWSIPTSPIWWANAYTSVPFGLDYVVWLIVWPLSLLILPFWLFTALTGANLAGANDDRSSGLKRWFVGACVILSGAVFATCFRVEASAAVYVALYGLMMVAFLLLLMAVLLVGDPIAPSRLVRARWLRLGTGPIGRMLGPGLVRGAAVQILFGSIALSACYAGGVLASSHVALRKMIGIASGTTARTSVPGALAIVLVYALMFDLFLVGLGTFLRTRKAGTSIPTTRAWIIAVAIIAIIVPWVLSTILGSFAHDRTAILVAAPSPAFAFFAFRQELNRLSDTSEVTVAALGAALVWGASGLVLLGIGWERGRRAFAAELRTEDSTTRRLDQEDEEDYSDDEEEEPRPLPVKPPPPMPGGGSEPA